MAESWGVHYAPTYHQAAQFGQVLNQYLPNAVVVGAHMQADGTMHLYLTTPDKRKLHLQVAAQNAYLWEVEPDE